MTYREAYMSCETLEDLEKMVQHDIFVANFMGSSDRLKVIKREAEAVANEKFGNSEVKHG